MPARSRAGHERKNVRIVKQKITSQTQVVSVQRDEQYEQNDQISYPTLLTAYSIIQTPSVAYRSQKAVRVT